mmetsp:Transcript_16018/g.34080  ORF Transcript_16018/g.34080 Transcript_16018/m.34080 type:complete len:214 (-) Transcript_16018:277-918(-)
MHLDEGARAITAASCFPCLATPCWYVPGTCRRSAARRRRLWRPRCAAVAGSARRASFFAWHWPMRHAARRTSYGNRTPFPLFMARRPTCLALPPRNRWRRSRAKSLIHSSSLEPSHMLPFFDVLGLGSSDLAAFATLPEAPASSTALGHTILVVRSLNGFAVGEGGTNHLCWHRGAQARADASRHLQHVMHSPCTQRRSDDRLLWAACKPLAA